MLKKPLTITLASISLVALAACEPGPDNQRTRTGVATGAFLGGAIGAMTGDGSDRLGRAAAGAIIGGIAGGAVGATLDRQAQQLRRDLGDDVDVYNTGEEIIVTMPQDILFAVDSAVVRPDLQRDLRVLASSLRDFPDTSVLVVGHTDNTGSASYNQALSERRANAVAAVIRDSGVPAWRVSAVGRGLTQPVASNATPQGRAQNRRVEIIIRPN